MAGTTYSKFFWQDWKGDEDLRSCSMGARGLWMYLLCFAASSPVPGHVLISGKKPTAERIRKAIGADEPAAQIEAWMKELVEAHVCDVTSDGVLVSRRMVRDFRKYQIRSSGGKARQRQISETISRKSPSSSRNVQQPDSATISHQPESINHQPSASSAAAPGKDDGKWVAKVSEALGWDITNREPGKVIKFLASWPPMRERGIDLDLDLLPVIRERRAASTIPGDLGSLRYFEKAALERKEARVALAGIPRLAAQPPGELTRKQWLADLERFLIFGTWRRLPLGVYGEAPLPGPSPLEEGCRVPEKLLEWARARWNEQGQMPHEFETRQGKKPIPFWGDNVIALPRKEIA